MYKFRVYAKTTKMKRFKPLDMEELQFVTNPIHASMFTSEELPKLKKYVQSLNELNPDYTFEIREIK